VHVAVADLLELDLDASLLFKIGQKALDDLGFGHVLHEGAQRYSLGMGKTGGGDQRGEARSGENGTEFQHVSSPVVI
jgi:hypothetical protein